MRRLTLTSAVALMLAASAHADDCPDVSQAVLALDLHVENTLRREGMAPTRPANRLNRARNATRTNAPGCVYQAHTFVDVRGSRLSISATMRSDGGWMNWQVANIAMR